MSNSQTEPTSTTASSTNSPSKAALIACGALAQPAADIVARRGWQVDVHPLPPLLHNKPRQIAPAVRELAAALAPSYSQVAVGYSDCGTYGALDELCAELGLHRLPGLHCYDVYAGANTITQLLTNEPGTYLLTDFLVKSFARTVEKELGLDRYPELLPDYFGHYTQVVWLAQEPTAELTELAESAAARIGLPLVIRPVGTSGLETALEDLVAQLS
ncbi:MAG: DUF1638 domain-containing protein [Marmoricola sp.]